MEHEVEEQEGKADHFKVGIESVGRTRGFPLKLLEFTSGIAICSVYPHRYSLEKPATDNRL